MRIATTKRLSEMLERLNETLGRPRKPYTLDKSGEFNKLNKHPGSMSLCINIGGVHIDKLIESGGCTVVSECVDRMKPKEAMIFMHGMFAAIKLIEEMAEVKNK